MKKLMLTVLAVLFTCSASAGVIYENDFSSGDTTGWTGGSIVNGAYQQNRARSSIGFRLNDPAINDSVDLSFDAIALGNWEQSGWWEDIFITIDRIRGEENVRLYTGNLNDGSNSFLFEDVRAFREDQLRITFKSDVTYWRELFAIDNVVVTSVAEPGSLALLGLGLLGLGFARRQSA